MPHQKLYNISASTMQVLVNQALGLVIFYITSRYLTKEIFGELNWSLATASLVLSTIGFGIDLMIVKRIASGENVRETAGLHIIHVLVSGTFLSAVILISYFCFPSIYTTHILLPGIMISQVISFFGSPYRQLANGNSAFGHLAVISTVSNIIKAILLTGCLVFDRMTLQNIVILFILGSVGEMIIGVILTIKKTGAVIYPLYWNFQKYGKLVKESFPQFGVTLFNVVLARFDWFLLGVLTTTTITAEYSFAYKVFELSRLPLLVISPVLIPLFVKIFKSDAMLKPALKIKLDLLFRTELIISVMLPLLLASCWTPIMENITNHKYGVANDTVFLLLAVCVPLQFATDYYWNLCFAQGQLKLTFWISVISCTLNVGLNLLFIPMYGAVGAAVAYVACFLIQVIAFKMYTKQDKIKPDLLLLLKTIGAASAAIFIGREWLMTPWLGTLAAVLLYFVFAVMLQLINPKRVVRSAKILLR